MQEQLIASLPTLFGSSDFIGRGHPEDATAYITDDYGHNIAPGQTYIHATYDEYVKKQPEIHRSTC